MRYLGNKESILTEISDLIESQGLLQEVFSFFDAFCGSGSVSDYFKPYFDIIINDNLLCMGSWYLIHDAFYYKVATYVNAIERKDNLLPACVFSTEGEYNANTAENDTNFCLMDKKLFNVCSDFSRLNKGNKDDYLITQYLTALVQTAGFDGIRFRSSLVKQGSNYVIFDSSNCEVNSSKMYVIPEVRYSLHALLEEE